MVSRVTVPIRRKLTLNEVNRKEGEVQREETTWQKAESWPRGPPSCVKPAE